MHAKFISSIVVIGMFASLAACRPVAPTEAEATVIAPSQAPGSETSVPTRSQPTASETSLPTPSPLPTSPEAPIAFDCDNAIQIAVWDCRALVALFESTDGANWKEDPGWLERQDPCSWYGVTCDDGHVTELVLYGNGLSGSLPVELKDLTHLRVIRMYNNQLSGSLSPDLGRLSNLIELDLARNQYTGEIPAELGRLTNLTWLNLSGNELSGPIPRQLGALGQLNYLDLASNRLSGSIPGQLGMLKTLSTLDLSHNQLSGSIPTELETIPNNAWLDLTYNELSGAAPDNWLPKSIDETPVSGGMSVPRLWGNQLEGTIPASNDSSTEIQFEGIRFRYPSALAESVWPQIVVSPPQGPGDPWWGSDVPHYDLTFASQSGPEAFQRTWGTWLLLPPQLKVYPVASLESGEFTGPRVEALRQLLEVKPASPADEIPLLPLINAAQVFRAQVRYLDFQNGSGVRFITQYRQDPGPVTDDEIFYTFQGLTDDGAYYIVASFPLATALLPDTILFESQAFREFEQKNYEQYLAEQVGLLDALPSDEFEPDLMILDQIVGSLEIQPQ